MPMMLKTPLSYSQQIARLREHGLSITDDALAEEYLRTVGYYTLSGYALSFRKSVHDSNFKPGTTFEQISICYEFAAELRRLLLDQLIWLEQLFRATIAYQFSESHCVDAPHDQHYDLDNYKDRHRASKILDSVEKHEAFYKGHAWYKHHKTKYDGKMPLWVLVRMLSFSSLSKYYGCLLDADQCNIAHALNTGPSILRNQMYCLSALRNRCAHGDRLYNEKLKPGIKLPKALKSGSSHIDNSTLFAYTLAVLTRITEHTRCKCFAQALVRVFDKYSSKVELRCVGAPPNYAEVINKYMQFPNEYNNR